jgi:iron complex outermembrane receptor protein
MPNFRLISTLYVVAALLYHHTVHANEPLAITTQSPIVVTDTPLSAPLVFVTDPKLPRQPLPASDATDYLNTIPGFSAIGNGGTNRDPVLRGQFGSRIAMLADGTFIPGACGGRMDPPTSYMSPSNFDQLIVIKGPQTVLWGPGASAGTVRFERDTPAFTEPGVRFDGSLVAGSFGRHDQAADLTVGQETTYARVVAFHSHAQDYRDGHGHTVPSRWDKWNADLLLGITPNVDTRLEMFAGTGNGEARYAGRGMDGTQFKRNSLGLRLNKTHVNDRLTAIQAQIYYNDANHVMDNYRLRTPSMGMKHASNVNRTTWGGRLATTWALSETTQWITGLDIQHSRHRSRRQTEHVSYRHQRWAKNATMENTGLFNELTWNINHSQRVISGARLDWAHATDYRSTRRPHVNASRLMSPTHRRNTLVSGFLRYEQDMTTAPVSFYVGLGYVERFPDYRELSTSRGPYGTANAWRGVKPEKTTQLDIGAHYNDNAVQAWVSAYAGYVEDFILIQYPTQGSIQSGNQARNVRAPIMGGELGVNYAVTRHWHTGTTLAYAWANNTSDHRPLPQIPPLEARLTATYHDDQWSAGILWRLVAPQHRYAINQGNVAGKDTGGSSGFSVLSINGGYAMDKHMQLNVGIDNVFNRAYYEHLNRAGYPGFGYALNTAFNEPGRTVWARVSVTY